MMMEIRAEKYGYKKFYLQFFCLLLTCFVSAQEYRHTQYTTSDGLPSNTTYKILEDSKGFIWIATDNGVSRFDGYSFRNFTVDDGLSSNDVLGLFEDAMGRVWFTMYQNTACYYYKDSIYQYPLNIDDTPFIPLSMHQHPNGDLWFGSWSQGLLVLDDDGIKKHFEPSKGMLFKNSGAKIDESGSVFFYSGDRIGTFDYSTDTFQLHPFLARGNIKAICPLNDSSFLYNTSLVLYLTSVDSTRIIKKDKVEENLFINFISLDKDQNLWLSTNTGYHYLSKEKDYQVTEQAFKEYKISYTYEDSKGNLWLATLDKGLLFINYDARKVKILGKEYGFASNHLLQAIKLQHQNKTLVSTNNGYIHTLHHNKVESAYLYFANFHPTQVIVETDSFLWCGSAINSIIKVNKFDLSNFLITKSKKYDPNIGKNTKHLFLESDISLYPLVSATKAMIKDEEGNIWAGGSTGLVRIIPKGKEYQITYYTQNRVTSLARSNNGEIYGSSINGLFKVVGDTIEYLSDEYPELKMNLYKMVFDGNDVLWACTDGKGALTFDGNKVTILKIADGLSSNKPEHIVQVDDKMLVFSQNGVEKITTTKNATGSWTYDIQPSWLRNALAGVNYNSVFNHNNDSLYLASEKGLLILPLEEDSTHFSNEIPIYITQLKVQGKDTTLVGSYTLPYNQNNINIEYVGLSYSCNQKINYQYRMLGVDTNWVTTTLRNTQYPTLPPGRYRFEVKAVDCLGYASTQPATVSFFIRPPYWQTWWFRLLGVMAAVVLVALITFAIVRYYKRQSDIAREITELEGQALRAQMNPHFIFNALNAIHDFIADNDQRSAHLYLAKFAALIRLVMENSKEPVISLQTEIETLKLYIDLENLRFSNKFDYTIDVDSSINPYDVLIPAMIIQPYIENAIRHGLMNKEGKGILNIAFNKDGDNLVVTVTDDGVGREKANEINQQQRHQHKSMGMSITRERLSLLNTNGETTEILEIEDLSGDGTDDKGTKVKFKIPIKTE